MWSREVISEAAKRPLFEEPTSACEREDPWSGPKGFMFGGMGLPTRPYLDTAQQYFDAANLLISDIESLRIEDYNLANPIFFLYRHWLELMVKENCRACSRTQSCRPCEQVGFPSSGSRNRSAEVDYCPVQGNCGN
jgi:hypothetical protein